MTLTTIANSPVDRPAASPRPLAAPPVPARTKMLLEAPIGPCATAGRYRRAPQCHACRRRNNVPADVDIRAHPFFGAGRTATALERNPGGRRIQLRHDLGPLLRQFRGLKEMAPDLLFSEEFTWSPGRIEISMDFWLDEAVLEYWIGHVPICPVAADASHQRRY
jgi:hypothetical protein